MVDVRKLIEYNQDIRHSYLDALAGLPWDEVTKNREASYHSLRNIFVHALNAMDYWLDFLTGEKLHSRRSFEEYRSIDDIRAYMAHVEDRMREYLDALTPEGLSKKYAVTNDAGETIQVSAEDVLIRVFEEEVHHRGEIIALMWQMDIEPPLMGWKYL
jgi:uncharacterized damage-inducible protein DinB